MVRLIDEIAPFPDHTRFDANGDGRIDLLNFLNFFLTRDRKERRRAARVTRALEAMREDALHKQVDKIKKKTIGQVDRCAPAGTACRQPLQASQVWARPQLEKSVSSIPGSSQTVLRIVVFVL